MQSADDKESAEEARRRALREKLAAEADAEYDDEPEDGDYDPYERDWGAGAAAGGYNDDPDDAEEDEYGYDSKYNTDSSDRWESDSDRGGRGRGGKGKGKNKKGDSSAYSTPRKDGADEGCAGMSENCRADWDEDEQREWEEYYKSTGYSMDGKTKDKGDKEKDDATATETGGKKGGGKGKGKGPVQGQSYAARKKEAHKSSAANHRRKDRFAKKMGM